MDFEEYRKRGKEMVDYIADYLENIRDRRVFPDVKPGYMHNLLPDSAPIEGEKWDNIFNDIERVIMPGITHWQSPHMHAYFPALNSFPSLLGDMLADSINCLGFTWASSPACTELETIVMNWLGKMIGLPNEFLHLNNDSIGGGVIQTTASESTLVCLLAGRTQAIQKFHEKTTGYQDAEINARLVAYCSDQAHSSVEKAALIGLVRMRFIETDENLSMRGKPLQDAIDDDIKQGLIPFWVCNTLGTTGACAFDNLDEVGTVCRKNNLWLHIDAAYAGSALICPEYRIWLKGIEKADSIAFNPSKWLMVHFDCTAMWVKDSTAVHRTFNVEPLYLQHENSGLAIDYMHWQIPLSKRFRALKLWFVLRSFGIKGLQKHIREGVRLAQKFEALVSADHRFEIPAQRHLGLVVFRINGINELTEKLLKRLNNRGHLHCVPASLKGKYIIRFTVTSTRTTTDDILNDWAEIKKVTSDILEELNVNITDKAKVPLKDTKEKNEAFGSSLLLSNSPMSPKIVNGSFAAIFDADEFLAKTYAGIRISHQDSPAMRRRVRGIMMSGKQFSLDSRMDLVVQSCYSANNDSTENSQPKAKPIREDSEDVWEAYELPETPTSTPTMDTAPSAIEYQKLVKLMESVKSISQPFIINPNFTYEMDGIQIKPKTQIIQNKNSTTNNFDKFISLTTNNNNNNNNNNNKNIKINNCCDSENLKLLSTTTNNQNLLENSNCTVTKRTNLNCLTANSSCNENNQIKHSTISTSSWLQDNNSSTSSASASASITNTNNVVYHGKRFLDPINIDGIYAFYNHGFNLSPIKQTITIPQHPDRIAFHQNVYNGSLSEIYEDSEDSGSIDVDWNEIKKNFNNYQKSLSSSSSDNLNQISSILTSDKLESPSSSSIPVWTSLDCSSAAYQTDNNLLDSRNSSLDDWIAISSKIQLNPIEQVECCKKCGHQTTSSESSS